MKKFFSNIAKPCEIDIEIYPAPGNKTIEVNDPHDQHGFENETQVFQLFQSDDTIKGKVTLNPLKAFDCSNVRIELIGEILMFYESKTQSRFLMNSTSLAPGGTYKEKKEFEFEFEKSDMKHESYRGINADVRYYIKVVIQRTLLNISEEKEFWVQKKTPMDPKIVDKGISMEVGLDKIVMLGIKYWNQHHQIEEGVVKGELKFYLVNVRIDRAEVSIKRREILGSGDYAVEEEEFLLKHQVIDGTPAKNEVIPLRIYLDKIPKWKLTPTAKDIDKRFSVKYFVHLALCDYRGRRFFKMRELVLHRS
jgi:vacuolar protein sorting-associated protein 26